MLSATVAVLGFVAIIALIVATMIVGRRTASDDERRIFRKWCMIWSVGVLLFLVTPGVLALLEVIPEQAAGILPAVYVVIFAPTIGWFVNEMGCARKKG